MKYPYFGITLVAAGTFSGCVQSGLSLGAASSFAAVMFVLATFLNVIIVNLRRR